MTTLPKTLVSLERVVPSLDGQDAVRAVLRELERDFPWAADRGWTVEFWGLRGRDAAVDACDGLRVRGPRLALRRLGTPGRAMTAWAVHFSLTLMRRRPGILLSPTPWAGAGAAAARALLTRRPPLVVRVQSRSASRALRVRRSRLRFHVIEALDRFVLRRADLVVPMGRYTEARARRVGVPPGRVLVLPFPPGWRDRPVPPIPDVRAHDLIVCGARLEREKGIDVLLTAFAAVVERCPDARLCIAGDGPERAALERLAFELGVASRVEFTGWLPAEEMWRRFASAGVAVLPSRWEEGLGMMLVEAALAGCALVASNLGGMPDMVRDGETGLLVPPEDEQALAKALIRCLSRPEERARWACSARDLAAAYVGERHAALEALSTRLEDLRARW